MKKKFETIEKVIKTTKMDKNRFCVVVRDDGINHCFGLNGKHIVGAYPEKDEDADRFAEYGKALDLADELATKGLNVLGLGVKSGADMVLFDETGKFPFVTGEIRPAGDETISKITAEDAEEAVSEKKYSETSFSPAREENIYRNAETLYAVSATAERTLDMEKTAINSAEIAGAAESFDHGIISVGYDEGTESDSSESNEQIFNNLIDERSHEKMTKSTALRKSLNNKKGPIVQASARSLDNGHGCDCELKTHSYYIENNSVSQRLTDNIPETLKRNGKFLGYRHGEKLPVDLRDGGAAEWVKRPECRLSFTEAIECLDTLIVTGHDLGGLSFCIDSGEPKKGEPRLVAVDIDHCVDDGELNELAKEMVGRFNSYAEFSPSGTGLHIYFTANKLAVNPKDYRQRDGEIEVYVTGAPSKLMRLSGFHIEGTPSDMADCSDELKALLEERLKKKEYPKPATTSVAVAPEYSLDAADILTKALQAENGHGKKFQSLYRGDYESLGYPSPSEALHAFCGMVSFWTHSVDEVVDFVLKSEFINAYGGDQAKISDFPRKVRISAEKVFDPNGPHYSAGYHTPPVTAAVSKQTDKTADTDKSKSDGGNPPISNYINYDAVEKVKESLEWTARNTIKNTIDNVLTVFEKDPDLQGFYLDSFKQRVYITEPTPWTKRCHMQVPKEWGDEDDNGVYLYLEKAYGITVKTKIDSGIQLAFESRKINSAKEYFESLTWDGIPRIDTLFIDYFGVEDNIYTREATRKQIVASVKRVYQPGCKKDETLVLKGAQGLGKSSCLAILGRSWVESGAENKGWYTSSLEGFGKSKDDYMIITGRLIVELGELEQLSKSDLRKSKSFLSKQTDDFRPPYAKRDAPHARQCTFWGTTNEENFLSDTTGERRWWPIAIPDGAKGTKNVFEDLEGEVDQIWAEAVQLYKNGESLILSPEANELAEEARIRHFEEDARKGIIEEWIKRPVQPGWRHLSIEDHMRHWESGHNGGGLVTREYVCAAEIYVECFGEKTFKANRYNTKEITRILETIPFLKKDKQMEFKGYGKPTAYKVCLPKDEDEDQ